MEQLKIKNDQDSKEKYVTREPFIVEPFTLADLRKESYAVLHFFKLHKPDFKPDFSRLGVIRHPDSSKSIVAWGKSTGDNFIQPDEHIEIVDVQDGESLGAGIIRYIPAPLKEDCAEQDVITNTPYVFNVWTNAGYEKRDLGRRRYLIMNQMAHEYWGKPLRAGKSTTENARKIWDKFVLEGRARKIEYAGDSYGYEFMK